MKVTCHECGKRYQVDVTKIHGDERSFRCRGCHVLITVRRPAQEPVVSDAAPARSAAAAMADFDSMATGTDDFFGTEPTATAPAAGAAPASTGFDETDWSDMHFDAPPAATTGDATADFILSSSQPETSFSADEVSDDLLSGTQMESVDAETETGAEASPEAAAPAVDEEEKAGLGTRLARAWQGLTGKVIFTMLLVGMIPLGIFGATSYFMTSKGLNQSAEKVMEKSAEGIATQVNEWVDKNVKVLQMASELPEIQSMDPIEQEGILRAVAKAYPWITLAFTLDADGINIARSDDRQPISYAHRQYYWDIVDGKQLSWQTLIESSTGAPALILAVPIREKGELVGVLAAAMKIDDIAQWVATWKEGQTGYAALVEKSGKIIVHPNRQLYELQYNLAGGDHPLALMFRDGKDGGLEFQNSAGQKAFGMVKSTQLGWGLMLEQESQEVFALTRQLQPIFFAVLVAAILLALLFGVAFARKIVTPVLRLSEAADRLSLGELDVVIDVDSKDEIGQLAKSITRMQDSLRIALEWLRSMK